MDDRIVNVPPANYERPERPQRQSKNLNVKVDLTGMEIFKSIVEVMEFLFTNADEKIKLEAIDKMEKTGILNLYCKG